MVLRGLCLDVQGLAGNRQRISRKFEQKNKGGRGGLDSKQFRDCSYELGVFSADAACFAGLQNNRVVDLATYMDWFDSVEEGRVVINLDANGFELFRAWIQVFKMFDEEMIGILTRAQFTEFWEEFGDSIELNGSPGNVFERRGDPFTKFDRSRNNRVSFRDFFYVLFHCSSFCTYMSARTGLSCPRRCIIFDDSEFCTLHKCANDPDCKRPSAMNDKYCPRCEENGGEVMGNLIWEKCSREIAVKALTSEADGTFLVRTSSRGGYVVSIVQRGQVTHVPVEGDAKSGFKFQFKSFPTINLLMQNTKELMTTSATVPVGKPLSPIDTNDDEYDF